MWHTHIAYMRVSWQEAGGRPRPDCQISTKKNKGEKPWEVTCVAGAKRGGRGRKAQKRKGNPIALPSSLLLNESKKRKGFWVILVFSLLNFKPRNSEDDVGDDDQPTFDQRWHTKREYVRHIRSWLPSHSKRKKKEDGGVLSLCSWSAVIPNFHEKQSSG